MSVNAVILESIRVFKPLNDFAKFCLILNWAIRKKKFKRISIEKITHSGVNNTLRLIFGLMGMNSFGLLLGGLFGMIASAFIFLPSYLTHRSKLLKLPCGLYQSISTFI